MRSANIEPGILIIFRLVTIISIILTLIHIILMVFSGVKIFVSPLVLHIVNPSILLAFLFSDTLEKKLKQLYLPSALLLNVAGTFILVWFKLFWNIRQNISPGQAIGYADSLLLASLFVPLLIVVTQYGLKIALGFTIAISALYYSLAWILFPINSLFFNSIAEQSFTLLILYLIIGFFFNWFILQQKKIRKTLSNRNLKLLQHATMVERLAISHERNRMARELHDTLAHTLSAVSVQLEVVNKQVDNDNIEALDSLKLSQSLIRQGLQETRRALQALRSSALDDMGFSLAIQHLIQINQERSGIVIELRMTEDILLSPQIEQCIYRITEEALNNITRHSQAHHASVDITYQGDSIELCIVDDGIGFNPEMIPHEGHYGLMGMRERTAICNGELAIESQLGTGTIIKLSIGDLI